MAGGVVAAIGVSGDAFVAWQTAESGEVTLWTRPYVPGTGWQDATTITTTTGQVSDFHFVVLDDSAAVLAVWREGSAAAYSIRSSLYVPGTGWSAAGTVAASDAALEFSVDLASDGNGHATVVWLKPGTDGVSGLVMWARRYALPDGWADSQPIDAVADEPDAPRGNSARPSVAMTPGHTVAVWEYEVAVDRGSWESTRTRIVAARHSHANTWYAPTVLVQEEYYVPDDPPFAYVGTPEVAVLPSGRASAYWLVRYDVMSTPSGQFRRCLSSSHSDLATNGSWTQPTDSRCLQGPSASIRLVNAAATDQSVHWLDTERPSTGWNQLIASETTLWSPQGSSQETFSYPARLAASVNGQVLVAFSQNPPGDPVRYSWNLEAPQMLESTSGRLVVGLDAAINANGDAIVAWDAQGLLFAKLFQ